MKNNNGQLVVHGLRKNNNNLFFSLRAAYLSIPSVAQSQHGASFSIWNSKMPKSEFFEFYSLSDGRMESLDMYLFYCGGNLNRGIQIILHRRKAEGAMLRPCPSLVPDVYTGVDALPQPLQTNANMYRFNPRPRHTKNIEFHRQQSRVATTAAVCRASKLCARVRAAVWWIKFISCHFIFPLFTTTWQGELAPHLPPAVSPHPGV